MMPDSEDREFIREKIMNRAGGRHYRLRRIAGLAGAAVLFGLIASLFFVLGERYFSSILNQDEELSAEETISVGRDEALEYNPQDEDPFSEGLPPEQSGEGDSDQDEELSVEETEYSQETDTVSEDFWEEILIQIDEAADQAVLDAFDEREDSISLAWYTKVGTLMDRISRGLVTVQSVTEDTDWFNNAVSSANQSSGVIFYITDAEVLVLADYDSVRDAQALTVTFANGRTADARVKKADTTTGLAVVSVSSGAVSDDTRSYIDTLTLGNSYQVTVGTPVVAAGCLTGYPDSVLTGMVSMVQSNTQGVDTAFQLLYTDVSVAEAGTGFLFNTNGDLIGIITQRYADAQTGQTAAIGISSLKGIIDSLSSGIDAAYLGVVGQNASSDIAELYDIPEGIYITKVIMDSPAYLAGLQAGDIIVRCEQTDTLTMQSLQKFLEDYSTGDMITVTVYRGSVDEYAEMEFLVTLSAR